MSFTRRVCSGVPSVTQSSWPCVRVVAVKNRRGPATVSWRVRARGPASTADTRVVPFASPVVFHTWKPVWPSSATK
ncbi:hypothetical protein FQZ97_956000 [compost metagenome]